MDTKDRVNEALHTSPAFDPHPELGPALSRVLQLAEPALLKLLEDCGDTVGLAVIITQHGPCITVRLRGRDQVKEDLRTLGCAEIADDVDALSGTDRICVIVGASNDEIGVIGYQRTRFNAPGGAA